MGKLQPKVLKRANIPPKSEEGMLAGSGALRVLPPAWALKMPPVRRVDSSDLKNGGKQDLYTIDSTM